MMGKRRIALVVSHPIGNFCPQYVSFAENNSIDFKVFFGSMLGYKKYIDPNFKKEVSWDNLHLDKFQHEFLNGDRVLMPDKNLDAASLGNALDIFDPDIVIVYGYFQRIQKRAYAWAKKRRIPLAYISDSELRQKTSIIRRLLKYPFLVYHFSNIRFFLSVGDANELFYKKHGVSERKIIRMHFPIDVKHYKTEYSNRNLLRQQTRKLYHIQQDELVLSVVGKLVEWKNQDHLIDALQIMEEKGIILHLFIIGSGENQQSWEKKALALKKAKVHFTGFIPISALPAYYAATDIYVHPASIEPHSIAISEAIYMGCPVILSDTCGSYGIADDVQEGKNGFVYKFGDIRGLCLQIEQLHRDKKKRSEFSEYSHQTGVAYQQQAHFGIIEDLLKQEAKLRSPKNVT
jgi:glycosyltransferase involved in cell wall biosynthesis